MNYKVKIPILLFFGIVLNFYGVKNNEKEQPNIVWITSEDNSKHYLKLFDEHGVRTPNIEKLADNGVTFTRAFSNSPVCSSARSTLISGCYGPKIASHYHRKIVQVPMPKSVRMFPTYLREAGYYTTNNSKEDYNILKSDSVWNESSNTASWRNRKDGQPFFHIFNIATTHESRVHFSKEYMKNNKTLTNPDSCFVQPNYPNTKIFKYTYAHYIDRIIEMDKKVGQVVNELRNDGLLEDTFIFYFGDHGGVLPGSKGYITETGIHIPLVVYTPQKYKHMVSEKIGSHTNRFVSFVDFGATVLNLASVKIPEGIDGKPFLGNDITLNRNNAHDETYSYSDRLDEKYDMVRAVRKGRYKYIRNYQPYNFDGLMNNYRYKQMAYQEWKDLYENNKLNDIQSYFFNPKEAELLFDIENDPYETKNLAKDSTYDNKLKEMRSKLNDWIKNMPDLSFYPEFYLINNAFDNPVEFGKKNKDNIVKYIDLANLQLSNFNSVKLTIEASLNSNDPWERYWGLIVCTSFGKKAFELMPLIKAISKNDKKIINKVRAAEFLGIVRAENPSLIMKNALYNTKNEIEALQILNSIVLMKDRYNYTFNINLTQITHQVAEHYQVKRRLKYLQCF